MSADYGAGPTAPGGTGPARLEDDLWRFAVSFYARPGVAPACLQLQERLGLDVNILLFGLFALLERRIALGAADLAAIDGLAHDWHVEIVRGLRRIRTRLKSGPQPAPSPATDALREGIKGIEIEAERIELSALAAWLERRPLADRASGATGTPAAVLDEVARHFARLDPAAALREPIVADALRTLARAADEACGRPHQP